MAASLIGVVITCCGNAVDRPFGDLEGAAVGIEEILTDEVHPRVFRHQAVEGAI